MSARPHLAAALDAVRFHPPRAFSWRGRREVAAPQGFPREARHALLAARLQERAYLDLYASGGVRRASPATPPRDADARAALVRALQAANAGRGGWEDGWRVEATGPEGAVLSKAGVRVRAAPDEHRAEADGARLRRPPGSLTLSPGHYVALSDAGTPRGRAMRAYVNVPEEGAAALVARLTETLAPERFALKVLVRAPSGTRRDAAVLFLEPAALDARWADLVDAARAAGARPGAPAFTDERAPGVGVAQDPGTGESFGRHRARLVAEGLLRARRARSRDAKLRQMEVPWEEAGVDVDRPHEGP